MKKPIGWPVYSLTWLLLSSIAFLSHAVQFQVVDQQGAPLAHAVVALRLDHKALEQAKHRFPHEQPAIMDQVNREFVPYVLAVAQGQQVIFPNHDKVRHHVYSFSPAKRFEIRLYAGTPSEPVTFDKPGVVVLGCNIHDAMLAFIYVSQSPVFGVTDLSGKVRLDLKTLPADQVEVWHPDLGPDAPPVTYEITNKAGLTTLKVPVH